MKQKSKNVSHSKDFSKEHIQSTQKKEKDREKLVLKNETRLS